MTGFRLFLLLVMTSALTTLLVTVQTGEIEYLVWSNAISLLSGILIIVTDLFDQED